MSLRAGVPRRRHRRTGRGPSARPHSRGGGARRESRAAVPSPCWRRGRARRRRSCLVRAALPRRRGASSSRRCRSRSPRESPPAARRGRPSSAGRTGRDLPSRRAGSRAGSPPASQLVLGPTDEPGHRVTRRRALRPREAGRLVGELGRPAAAELAAEPFECGAPPARDRRGSPRGARERAPAGRSRAARSHDGAGECGGRTAASARTPRAPPRCAATQRIRSSVVAPIRWVGVADGVDARALLGPGAVFGAEARADDHDRPRCGGELVLAVDRNRDLRRPEDDAPLRLAGQAGAREALEVPAPPHLGLRAGRGPRRPRRGRRSRTARSRS